MPTYGTTICLLVTTLISPALATPPEGYALVWADEFDIDGPPDSSKWSFEHGFKRNNEDQWYQSENAVCRDGRLVIEARRERRENPQHEPSSGDWRRNRPHAEYTSSLIRSRGKFDFLYGVLEVRARIDARQGLWPAIWTLGNGPWPACGEVDLMEHKQGTLLANACWATPPGKWERKDGSTWDAHQRPLSEVGPEGWADDFHVWRMDWNADRIVLSVDDLVLNEIDLTAIAKPKDRPHPFRHPHYVLLNLAIGGDGGGDPSETEFPGKFEVDHVRVYQPANSGRK
ncbi:MAG: glycoside hydrolase family 16 protein [Planctomycetota bacterium]